MKMDELMEDYDKLYQDEEQKKIYKKKKSDLVSKKLGELLLQGYRMLNSTCKKCDCILMQKKNEPYYCVSCQDQEIITLDMDRLNSQVLKDNPMIGQIEENVSSIFSEKKAENQHTTMAIDVGNSVNIIKSKIAWATEQLKNSNVLSYDLELLDYIKKCSETITILNNTKI
ncbi:Sjoegren syndrome scleroderma autoantigen 1 [Brachionus plicatilis]|uniref:Sjoegren syndrome scleroderma autoantigen 1 n=1 Tax=Brachionus plicatilis TaxID=10195 RepID=A0A3M7REU7_BRAPC|nr:Sjoegren syndrome scleroderma autoantigen 1 [Brachionus plicatilis]